MSVLSLGLWAVGVVLIAVGYLRAREPWSRYQALRAEAANERRYSDWRGGVRDTGTTGADVAMAMFRRDAQAGAVVCVAGFIVVLVGFLVG